MAENSSLVTRQCVTWRTERPYIKRLRVSPSFNFQNSSWSLSIGFSEKNEYYVQLKREFTRQLFRTFDVTTSLESLTGRSVLSQTVTVEQTPHLIWSARECDVLENLPALKDYGEFTVVCVFRCFDEHSDAKGEAEISVQEFKTDGYLTNTISNGDFHKEKLQESSTKYSHYVSWMLLIGTFLVFAIIGTLYMTEVQKSSQTANKKYLKFCSDIPYKACKRRISVSQELHQLLTTVAGQYDCDIFGLIKNRNLTVSEARSRLYEQLSDESIREDEFKYIFHESLKLIFKNPDWGIKWYSNSAIEIANIHDSSIIDSSALEATQAAKPLWCRVRLSLQWTTSRLLVLSAFIFMLFCSYVLVYTRRREALKRLFYETVEKLLDILREPQDSSHQHDSHLEPHKGVVNNRDALLLPKERKDKPRVSVENKNINAEDFKVGRWHCFSSAESEGGQQGKVCQGQAFNSLVKRKNATYSPTPCLKIRNMFDPEDEYDEDWEVNIQDAILEKCEGNDGIKHLAVDICSTKGCVYMLCSSSEAADKAFNALHGWWFDGKLVTVKYIRYERYLKRFPAAENCVEP